MLAGLYGLSTLKANFAFDYFSKTLQQLKKLQTSCHVGKQNKS